MAKVARCTLLYYGASTAAAVVLGILLVNVIQPGRGEPLAGGAVTSCRQPDRTVSFCIYVCRSKFCKSDLAIVHQAVDRPNSCIFAQKICPALPASTGS